MKPSSAIPNLRLTTGTATFALATLLYLLPGANAAESDPFTHHEPPPIAGRWDLKVHGPERDYPSWLDIQPSGYRAIVGCFVGRTGSARPISSIDYDNGKFRFVLPPQWERRTNDIVFEGRLEGDMLKGQTTDDKGAPLSWEARRAPSLKRSQLAKWGKQISLFNGHDLAGWKARNPAATNGWSVQGGALINAQPGNDLVTERLFGDFNLHVEFRYPKQSNSGIYLRGRYEVQVQDDFGKEPTSDSIGGVYGFLTPRVNAAKRADEWQILDITLVGRTVTVILNGEPIVERQSIPGITGGALDSDEGQPGPIMLQGDHGVVEFRKVLLTPGE